MKINEMYEDSSFDRIDKYLTSRLTNISRSQIMKAIEQGDICVQGEPVKKNYKLKNGDHIEGEIQLEAEMDIIAEDIPLDIIYEDAYLLVINKPSGMVVHPAPGHYHGTLVNALLYYTKNQLSSSNEDTFRPGIVHRIDKDTSGLLLVAKTNEVHNSLAEMIRLREVKRSYFALVYNHFEEEAGRIEAPIGRNPHDRKSMIVTHLHSKDAVTHFKVIERLSDDITFIQCILDTGRTHQIRAHMKYIEHPIVNDPIYSKDKATPFGQFLHAYSLQFEHPITKEPLAFSAPLPEEFEHRLKEEKFTKHDVLEELYETFRAN